MASCYKCIILKSVNMKKLFIAMMLVLAAVATAGAQKMNLYASYGGYTLMDAGGYKDGVKHVDNAWGALNVGFNVQVLPRFQIGPSYTFSSTSQKGGGVDLYYHVIMFNARYDYFRTSFVRLYAHLGIGADITHVSAGDYTHNKGYFAFQFSPLGADVDLTRHFTMFGELGFGAQGLLQVGVRYNF